MPNSATARDRAEFYYEEAISKFNSNRTEAINNLAYAIHYIQDVGVPHHSANKVAVLSNHSAFEERASTALLAEDADWGDIDYDINFYNARPSQSAGDFVHEIASRTNPLITVAADENNIAGQNLLIPFLLLDSMQNTSGVLYKFAKEVGMI